MGLGIKRIGLCHKVSPLSVTVTTARVSEAISPCIAQCKVNKMERDFDTVTSNDKGKTGIVTLKLRGLKKDDPSHTVSASKLNGNLKVTAMVDGKAYGCQIDDVDIQDGIKCVKHNGYAEVTVTKNSDFKLSDKI